MLYNTRAIVLRNVRYGETSLITDMFTEQKGHQTFIIHSVRKAKATTPSSYLQLLSLVDMVAYYRDHKKINHIKEVRIEHAYQSIPFDPRKSTAIICLSEILSKSLTTSYPQPELFQFIYSSLIDYDHPDTYDADFIIRFLVGLTHHLGFGMEIPTQETEGRFFDLQEGRMVADKPLHQYVADRADMASLQRIMNVNGENPVDLPAIRRLIDLLILYYQLHVDTLRQVSSLPLIHSLYVE